MSKTDIILAGVGGQGILTIAAAIGYASMEAGMHIKQSEVHGMSQRGGAVQSHLRISTDPVASDLIPKGEANLILSVEPMEGLRYLPYLRSNGWLVTNAVPYENISDYPDYERIEAAVKKCPNHIWMDAESIAKKLGSPKSSNMVILGAAAPYIGLTPDQLHMGISRVFNRKGAEVVEANIHAFDEGLKWSHHYVAGQRGEG
ncbi:MAG: indolepyruvate oxidoreductase subunit beta [Bacteroidales bacterium]|nr:indolepyruvate oxidoreductase subunit beta [Bacteroidales bacterium]